MDYSEPLRNGRHERFCQLLATGLNQSAAYLQAGYNTTDAAAKASRLAATGNVKARVLWMKRQSASDTVLTIKEKRDFLARVVRAKLREVPEDSTLWQEVTDTEHGKKRKLPDKLRAIQLDNDLAGEGSEALAFDSLAGILSELTAQENATA